MNMSEAHNAQHSASRRAGYTGGASGSRPEISRKGSERECNPKLEIAAGETPATHADTSNAKLTGGASATQETTK